MYNFCLPSDELYQKGYFILCTLILIISCVKCHYQDTCMVLQTSNVHVLLFGLTCAFNLKTCVTFHTFCVKLLHNTFTQRLLFS